jgi:dihydropyrimidinase/dihydroorotase
MIDLAIRNGRVIAPNGVIYGGIGVEGSTIVYVGSNSGLARAKKVIDAGGAFVIPGLIDVHVHLAGGIWPTLAEGLQAQFARETEGALHGGVTTLGHFLSAVIGTSLLSSLETVINIGNQLSHIDFFCHGCIVDELHLQEQPELCRRGVTSFKHFFNPYKGAEGMGKFAPCDEGMLFRSFEFLAGWGYPALGMVHCEEMDVILVLMDRLRKAGRKDLLAWTEARPTWVEAIRAAHALEIAKVTHCPLYIVHISTAEGAEIVAEARRQGYAVWGETCPHYVTHTGEMEEEIGCWGKINPSLKYRGDIDALWHQMRAGGITNLGTDHGTNTRAYKEQGGGKHSNIWEARPIMCGGLEHLLPVMMTYGVNAGRILMEDFVKLASTNNAKVFGLYPRKGVLVPGSDADIVIIDPEKTAVVDEDFYHCQSEFSIYGGWKLKGKARTTVVRGKIMMEDYETVGTPGHGKYVLCQAY